MWPLPMTTAPSPDTPRAAVLRKEVIPSDVPRPVKLATGWAAADDAAMSKPRPAAAGDEDRRMVSLRRGRHARAIQPARYCVHRNGANSIPRFCDLTTRFFKRWHDGLVKAN